MKKTMPVILRSVLCILILAAVTAALYSCKSKEFIPDEYARINVQGVDIGMTNTPTKMLFHSNDIGSLGYYSIADKKCYSFNSDPLGGSGDASILSSSIFIEYCNGRVYGAVWGDLYSVALDASDAKIIYSSDESEYSEYIIQHLSHYDQYLYFCIVNGDDGYDLYRYNTLSEKIDNLSKNVGIQVMNYFFGNNCIYFMKSDSEKIYKADLSLGGITELKDAKPGVFDGIYTYGTEKRMIGDEIEYLGIFRCNLEAGNSELIYEEPNKRNLSIVFIDEQYIYFFITESVDIGKYQGNIITTYTGGKLWRVDNNGENCRCIFNDIRYEINSINKYDGILFANITEFNVSNPESVTCDSYVAKLITDNEGVITKTEKLNITR